MRTKFYLFFILSALFSGCAGPNLTLSHHYKAPALSEKVQNAADKFYFYQQSVPAIANRKLYTRVYKSKEKNAYVDYNKYYITISITDSLAEKLDDTAMYCVFAHECAHAEYLHIGKKQVLSRAVSLMTNVADAVVPGYGIGLSNILLNPLFVNTYSRKEEIQADSRALYFLANMGINYEAFIKLLELLIAESPKNAHGGGLLDTHPSIEARIKNAEQLGSKFTVPDVIADYPAEKHHPDFSKQKLEIEKKFPFDIGAYGQSKALLLSKYLSDKQVVLLFDGFNPNKKKKINKTDFLWIYNIPQRKYCFYIFMRKDSAGRLWVDKYSIDKKNKRIKYLDNFI
ncbi:M48 family metalloprotease [bacterium]|nr:M48 family metalloprotease [bacterium]